MADPFSPMREIPQTPSWSKTDVVVIFGELFQRGYVNGLVEEAMRHGAKVIYSTVGRRDSDGNLRPLTTEELKEKDQPLINVPLEAGFDLQPSKAGPTPVDQLSGLKLGDWETFRMNWEQIKEARDKGVKDFRLRTQSYLQELSQHIPADANVLFVHTMAGGVPRAKIVMPAMNRVFKGHGDRYASSEEFWKTDIGRFCAESFMEVTAQTLEHLIELSAPIRDRQAKNGKFVHYVAYGYHGTEVLMGDEYRWQSYSPYLQGFAKIALEEVARNATAKKIPTTVFNAPEILTNSSSIFLGVEVSLYPLLGALRKEGSQSTATKKLLAHCQSLLKPETTIDVIMAYTKRYFESDIIRQWSRFDVWPQHNGPEQMALMREASSHLMGMNKDPKNMITSALSEVVFRGCGSLMFAEAYNPQRPVWWLGHDIIAKQTAAK